jgi:hypothetical protein
MTCAKVNFWFVSVEYVLKVLRIQAGANMNPKGKLVSLIYALVLFGCAFLPGSTHLALPSESGMEEGK